MEIFYASAYISNAELCTYAEESVMNCMYMGAGVCVSVLGVGDHHASEKCADLSKNPPHCFADGRLTCIEDETIIVRS